VADLLRSEKAQVLFMVMVHSHSRRIRHAESSPFGLQPELGVSDPAKPVVESQSFEH